MDRIVVQKRVTQQQQPSAQEFKTEITRPVVLSEPEYKQQPQVLWNIKEEEKNMKIVKLSPSETHIREHFDDIPVTDVSESTALHVNQVSNDDEYFEDDNSNDSGRNSDESEAEAYYDDEEESKDEEVGNIIDNEQEEEEKEEERDSNEEGSDNEEIAQEDREHLEKRLASLEERKEHLSNFIKLKSREMMNICGEENYEEIVSFFRDKIKVFTKPYSFYKAKFNLL